MNVLGGCVLCCTTVFCPYANILEDYTSSHLQSNCLRMKQMLNMFYYCEHGCWLLKISGGAYVWITDSSNIHFQRIQNADDYRESAPKTKKRTEWNYSVFTCLSCSWIPRNLRSQNKTDHIQPNQLYYVSNIWRWEGLWKTINIQQQILLGSNEYVLMLIKHNNVEVKSLTECKGSSWVA